MKIEQGKYYHLFNRGNNRGLIFFEQENYQFFLHHFEHYVIPYCELYAYCLMPNHFHLFIKVIDKIRFEKALKNFFISYVKSINKRYDRVGSLFQGRYKAKEVDSDSYYTKIIIYIHHNPLMAGLVSKLADYKYSSYQMYLSGDSQQSFISKGEVLKWFYNLEGFILSHE